GRQSRIVPAHVRIGLIDWGLVAESAELGHPSSELFAEQSDGRGFQLRRRIQETRSGCAEEGHPRVDDDLAGLVARRLRSLWTAVHSNGVAQRGHLPCG